jgi:hypothetical protein
LWINADRFIVTRSFPRQSTRSPIAFRDSVSDDLGSGDDSTTFRLTVERFSIVPDHWIGPPKRPTHSGNHSPNEQTPQQGDPHTMTKAIWAMAHGVATVSIADQAEDHVEEKTAIGDQVTIFIGFLLDGLVTQP